MKFWDHTEFIEKYKVNPLDFVLRHFLTVFDTSLEGQGLVIGCQEESSALILHDLGYRMEGVDLQTYKEDIFVPFDFYDKPIQEFDFKDNKYDFIVCLSTLQYVGMGSYKGDIKESDSDIKVLKNMASSLKVGGVLYLSVPVGRSKCPIGGRVYKPSDIIKLIPSNLDLVDLQAIYSEAYYTHGEDLTVKLLTKEDAFQAADYIPEMFYTFKKGRSLEKDSHSEYRPKEFKPKKYNKRSNNHGN